MDFVGDDQYMPLPDDRLVIISDIHGNADALKATLSDANIDPDDPDPVLCLGDIAGKHGQSSECIEILREVHATRIRGNHDMFQEVDLDPHGENDVLLEDSITEIQKDWLSRLPDFVINDEIMAVHAAPSSPQGIHLDDEPAIIEALKECDRRILLTGHTHIPMDYIFYPWNEELIERDLKMESRNPDEIERGPDQQKARRYLNPGSISEARGARSQIAYLEYRFNTEDRPKFIFP